jgi:excisionase family DNA binding protein
MSKTLETVREAASHTGLPERRIYELVKYAKEHPGEENNIPFVPVGSRIYFRGTALEKWLEALEGAVA